MHSLDPLQVYAHEYIQDRIDEAAHDALLASLPRDRSPRTPLGLTHARRYLADALRVLAARLDAQSLAAPAGIARPR